MTVWRIVYHLRLQIWDISIATLFIIWDLVDQNLLRIEFENGISLIVSRKEQCRGLLGCSFRCTKKRATVSYNQLKFDLTKVVIFQYSQRIKSNADFVVKEKHFANVQNAQSSWACVMKGRNCFCYFHVKKWKKNRIVYQS